MSRNIFLLGWLLSSAPVFAPAAGPVVVAAAGPETAALAPAEPPYWQQHVRYTIDVTLEPDAHLLSGRESLLYTNGSPDTLRSVWFHAYPNAYKDEHTVFAKESIQRGEHPSYFQNPRNNGYMEIDSLRYEGRTATWSYKPGDETEIHASLPEPLPPGQTGRFDIAFQVKVPIIFSRMGREERHYEISQWYPKIAVYDRGGWHPDGYHVDGEFYGDYGAFDVRITLPADYTVASTGVLSGPPSEIARLDSLEAFTRRLRNLPKGSQHRSLAVFSRSRSVPATEKKTIQFRAENVHDFAWCADPAYLLERNRSGLTEVDVFLTSRNFGPWRQVGGIVADALAWHGKLAGSYDYPVMSVAGGAIAAGGGMEYPNLILISESPPAFTRALEEVMVHETAHQWFYGMIGSDEMNEAWLDEGMSTYTTTRYMEEKYGREKNLLHWPQGWRWLPGIDSRWFSWFEYHLIADSEYEEPILQPAWRFGSAYGGMVYAKGALFIRTLQTVLGDSTFDAALGGYASEWRFRHPHTGDFREVMERTSGRDLGTFFDDFLSTTKRSDYAAGRLKSAREAGGWRTEVEVRRKGEARIPSVPVRLRTRDGLVFDRVVEGAAARDTLVFHTAARASSFSIDPGMNLLEIDHVNDREPHANRLVFLVGEPSFSKIDHEIVPFVGHEDDAEHFQPGVWIQRGNRVTQDPLERLRLYYATGTRRLGFAAAIRERTPLVHHRSFLDARWKEEEGYGQQRLGWKASLRPSLDSWSSGEVSIAAFRDDLRGLAAFDHSDWEKAETAGLEAGATAETRSYAGSLSEEIHVRSAFDELGDFHYTRFTSATSGALRGTRRLGVSGRLFFGAMRGRPPLQERIYLSGDVDAGRNNPFVLDREGDALVPLHRFHIDGGPNLPGYAGVFRDGIDPAGSAAIALNLRASFGRPLASASVFYDAGNVATRWRAQRLGEMKSDAGVRFALGPLDVIFPLWVSNPKEGEPRWNWRWLFGLGMPRLSAGVSL